jgi:citrate lyase subunit beta/citryl-CoA lyase
MWGGAHDDLAGWRAFPTWRRNLGYNVRMSGRAEHVALVHEVFTPTAEEIAYWRELYELAAEAERVNRGPIRHGDPRQGEAHVVHIAHVGSARKNLDWARDLGVID